MSLRTRLDRLEAIAQARRLAAATATVPLLVIVVGDDCVHETVNSATLPGATPIMSESRAAAYEQELLEAGLRPPIFLALPCEDLDL